MGTRGSHRVQKLYIKVDHLVEDSQAQTTRSHRDVRHGCMHRGGVIKLDPSSCQARSQATRGTRRTTAQCVRNICTAEESSCGKGAETKASSSVAKYENLPVLSSGPAGDLKHALVEPFNTCRVQASHGRGRVARLRRATALVQLQGTYAYTLD